MSSDQVVRHSSRFETDLALTFKVPYAFRTEISFTVDPLHPKDNSSFLGFTRNISVNGLCFESPKELAISDYLWIELHLPKHSQTIYMEGDVRWSQVSLVTENSPKVFLTGVSIKKVDGVPVDSTVYLDETYKVLWSQLLEKVLGDFAKICRKEKQ